MAIYALSIKHKSKGNGAPARAHAQYIAREGKYRERDRSASAHTDYLTREGRYTHRAQELEQTWSGNLPTWAGQSAKEFWDAADIYERANGRTYTEIVIALPRELSKEERREVVNEFIDKEIGDRFPYTAAIHNPRALDGGEQPHVHIMFSLREQDGIERSKEQFFKRANDRDPSRGGAKKSREWSKDDPSNDRVNDIRVRWETLANRALEKAGRAERIDRRSLKDQGIEREPEPKMGPEVTQRLKRGEVTDVGQTVLYLRDYRRQERELRALEEELGREKAKVYQFPQPSQTEQEEPALSFSKVGETRAVPEDEKRRYQRVLDLVFDRKQDEQGHTEYRWKRSGKAAFVDEGDRIRFTNSNETAIKAGIQLAKEKGWTTAYVEGGEAFKREFWIQAQLQGLGVTGYEHTKDDELEVENRQKALSKKKEAHKDSLKTPSQREPKRSEFDAPEYRASDLERDIRRNIIPPLEDRTRAFYQEMKQLGFNADGADPLSWHYKIKKIWDDLPTDDELKAKTFAATGGTAYAKLKTEAAQTNEKATQSAELLQQFDEQPVGGLQRLNPVRALERTRLVKACKEAEKAAKEAEKAKADEEKRLSSGPNAARWNRTFAGYQAERKAVEARRAWIEREHRAATAELADALGVQRKLKKLGYSKIRARVRAGKMPEIDVKELDARTREHEQKKEQQHNLGLSRSRFRR